MAGPPLSYETKERRAFRLALGVTATFTLAQLVNWPVALIAPAAAVAFMQDAKPMTLGKGAVTIIIASLAVVAGFLFSLTASVYPAVMVIGIGLIYYLLYRFVMTTGEHLVIFVGLLVGFTVVPVLVRQLPELAYIAVGGDVVSFLAAWLIATFVFAVMPAPEEIPPDHHGHGDGDFDLNGIAANLALVLCGMLAIFLYFGLTDILILVYTGLFALGVSSAGSTAMSLQYLKGNLLYAGIGMVVVYEILVIAPFLPLMVCLIFLATYILGLNIFAHKPTSGAWSSGCFGFVLLLMGALGPDAVVASAKVFDRLSHMAQAAIYVTFAFALLDWVRSLRASPKPKPH